MAKSDAPKRLFLSPRGSDRHDHQNQLVNSAQAPEAHEKSTFKILYSDTDSQNQAPIGRKLCKPPEVHPSATPLLRRRVELPPRGGRVDWDGAAQAVRVHRQRGILGRRKLYEAPNFATCPAAIQVAIIPGNNFSLCCAPPNVFAQAADELPNGEHYTTSPSSRPYRDLRD